MVTAEESIPKKSASYRSSEDVFYVQFNDVFFYIEDEDQENFFFCILRNLFPDIKIEKIFPLNGKDNVIQKSKECIDEKKKVFIVDKDFDDIFNRLITQPNLFYLDRYSIENHLMEENAIVEYIIGENPKLKKGNVKSNLGFKDKLETIFSNLDHIIYLHLLVQYRCPHLPNVSLNHERFVQIRGGNFVQICSEIRNYESRIEAQIKHLDGRYTLKSQLQKVKNDLVKLNSLSAYLTHVPGKYIIKIIKQLVESDFSLPSRNIDSFNYRIAEKCNFRSLENLKDSIHNRIN